MDSFGSLCSHLSVREQQKVQLMAAIEQNQPRVLGPVGRHFMLSGDIVLESL